MREAVVYFQTPSELRSHPANALGKAIRIGGQVVPGSLFRDREKLLYVFDLTDGVEKIRVRFQGIPPDLFKEGKGAVVEGRLASDGSFHAKTILAKHAEEYSPPQQDGRAHPRTFIPGKEDKGL
jgi:cytochrome c-type biogenesis protein CcmE